MAEIIVHFSYTILPLYGPPSTVGDTIMSRRPHGRHSVPGTAGSGLLCNDSPRDRTCLPRRAHNSPEPLDTQLAPTRPMTPSYPPQHDRPTFHQNYHVPTLHVWLNKYISYNETQCVITYLYLFHLWTLSQVTRISWTLVNLHTKFHRNRMDGIVTHKGLNANMFSLLYNK